jgi:hypothetical protein
MIKGKLFMQRHTCCTIVFFLIIAMVISVPALSDEAAQKADLAKKILNPVADLISLPFQFNYDHKIGPTDDGKKYVVNIQPVIPISIGPEWNVISRTILPIVDQDDILPDGSADATGIGDITQSFFFSPKKPTARGWIWGAGPVLLLPTASDDDLGGEKWGLGPTAVALKQEHGFTYGLLANHIWSVAGDSDRSDISATYLQPFFAYTTKTFTSFTINTESTYDWMDDEWSVPINFMVSQVLKIGSQPVSLQAGPRYWADSADNGPEGWGFRFTFTFLFPE